MSYFSTDCIFLYKLSVTHFCYIEIRWNLFCRISCFVLLFKEFKKLKSFHARQKFDLLSTQISLLHLIVSLGPCLSIVQIYCSWDRALPCILCYTVKWNDSMCQCIHLEICFKQWLIWLWIWQMHCWRGRMRGWRHRERYWDSVGPKAIQKQTFSFTWPHSLLRRPYVN